MRPRFFVLAGIVLAVAASRLVPHLPNFAPVTALALFGGAQFQRKDQAFLIPLAAMFLSDLVIGFHSQMPAVYLSFALIVLIGRWVRERKTAFRIAEGTLLSSLLFFVLSNFGVWAFDAIYPKTAQGLIACYVAAVPFFRETLLGDAVYVTAFFGGLALAERWIPALREPPLAVAA